MTTDTGTNTNTDLVLLRAFYSTWTEFHSVPRDRLHRRQHEIAAQEMVDAHNALKLFYEQHAKPHLALVAENGQTVASDFDKANEHARA
jgi:hypothetical protein